MQGSDNRDKRRWGIVGLALSLALAGTPPVCAVSVERLDEREVALLQSTVKGLDPLITERKKAGTAPLITFQQLYSRLTSEQIAFLEEFRQLEPATLGGSSRKLPPPTGREEFIRLNRQVILKEDKPIRLDTQYLPRPVYEAYRRMMAAMERDLGKRLLVESGYRSPAYQLYLFLFYLPKHGYSIRETNRFVALPNPRRSTSSRRRGSTARTAPRSSRSCRNTVGSKLGRMNSDSTYRIRERIRRGCQV
jgi:hypothetical protein